ncbi:hypothetical protein Tco_1082834 [Tanacetum coccineum]|uniref:Uncharacterized protein n=1 Tax=Tanacetum coccineum TaxID=301880 RepID=A0ABQ5I2S9_9ASTR
MELFAIPRENWLLRPKLSGMPQEGCLKCLVIWRVLKVHERNKPKGNESRRSTKEDELRLCDIFVVAREDDREVTEGREDVREVNMEEEQRGSYLDVEGIK